jgi:hypothetical protein
MSVLPSVVLIREAGEGLPADPAAVSLIVKLFILICRSILLARRCRLVGSTAVDAADGVRPAVPPLPPRAFHVSELRGISKRYKDVAGFSHELPWRSERGEDIYERPGGGQPC